jgi:hypothetical protein
MNTSTQFKISDDTVALIFGIHKWGNSRSANLPALMKARNATLPESAEAKRLKLSKQLLVSTEYDRIGNFMTGVKEWIAGRSVPSFFRDGCFLFNLNMVTVVDVYLNEQKPILQSVIDEFMKVYPTKINEAKAILEPDGQFNVGDYPMPEDLRSSFYWDYQWVSFVVPEGLPTAIREQAVAKMQNMWDDAAVSITSALREGFGALVTHAIDKLTPAEDGKRKVIRDTFVPNLMEFLDTFNNRNVTNDIELQVLVNRARTVMSGIDSTKELKDNAAVQKVIRREFEKISKTMETMIVDKPRRSFNFDEEGE